MSSDLPVDFLEYVVKSLVDYPESVKVTKTVDEMGVLLTLDVHAEDMGKIIGRKGATAKSIRTLLRVVGMKSNARVNMKILEPEGGLRAEGGSFQSPVSSPVGASAADMDAAIDDLKADL
jgi:predicted RNA-binding protein YlqC (UPF0109 family)